MSWTTHLAARPARLARLDSQWRRRFAIAAAHNSQALAHQPTLKPNQTKSNQKKISGPKPTTSNPKLN
jgi:hypothetical protein